MDEISDIGSWGKFSTKDIHIRDLAALTAKTGHEFACFTKGNTSIIVHGGHITWNVPEDAWKEIVNNKYEWKAQQIIDKKAERV